MSGLYRPLLAERNTVYARFVSQILGYAHPMHNAARSVVHRAYHIAYGVYRGVYHSSYRIVYQGAASVFCSYICSYIADASRHARKRSPDQKPSSALPRVGIYLFSSARALILCIHQQRVGIASTAARQRCVGSYRLDCNVTMQVSSYGQ